MNNMRSHQAGVASIYFVFIVVAVMAVGTLGVEGARYISDKARLGDVMEATVVAVSETDDLRTEKFDKERARKVADAWVNYLMPDSKGNEFKFTREAKKIDHNKHNRTVHEYSIDSEVTKESWMHMQDIPSFDKTQSITNRATAARVRTDFEPVDVVFVADFSGSMAQNKQKKLKALKESIESVN